MIIYSNKLDSECWKKTLKSRLKLPSSSKHSLLISTSSKASTCQSEVPLYFFTQHTHLIKYSVILVLYFCPSALNISRVTLTLCSSSRLKVYFCEIRSSEIYNSNQFVRNSFDDNSVAWLFGWRRKALVSCYCVVSNSVVREYWRYCTWCCISQRVGRSYTFRVPSNVLPVLR